MRRLANVLAAVAVSLALVAPATAASAAAAPRDAFVGSSASAPGIQVGPPLPVPPPASPSTVRVDGGHGDHPGFFDIPGKVKKAIDDWFRGLVQDALNPALKLVGRTLLSTPQIAGQARVRQFWQFTLGIADALLVLVIVIGGAIAMGHETFQTRYALKDTLPRLAFAAIASNASLAISGQMVSVANALASGMLLGGVDPAKAGGLLEHYIVDVVTRSGIFVILLGLACAVFAVVLLILYIVRAAVIVLLVCAAPLMLLAHALPQTEGIARMWWRAMTAALAVEVIQALILAATVQVFFTPAGHGILGLAAGSLVDLLIALCLLWLLVKVPFWLKSWAFSSKPSRTTLILRSIVISRVMRAAGVFA